MGTSIVLFLMLFVFLARDVQLLSTYQNDSILKRLAAYACSIALCTGLLVVMAHYPQPVSFQLLIRLPAIWEVSVALHLCVLVAALWVKRRSQFRIAWWISVLPTPVLLVCLLSIPFEAGIIVMPHPAVAAASVAAGWSLLVSAAILLRDRLQIDGDFLNAIDYAAMSNCTVLVLLVPINSFA